MKKTVNLEDLKPHISFKFYQLFYGIFSNLQIISVVNLPLSSYQMSICRQSQFQTNCQIHQIIVKFVWIVFWIHFFYSSFLN